MNQEGIKIPWPTEGVIRTAAIDDTITPEDSVQIGVNINFDRIGAWQTRLGITAYADALFAPIRNFGTLYRQFAADSIRFNARTGSSASATSLTFSHSPAGDDRALFVSVVAGSDGDVITGVTFNGVAMSLVAKTNEGTDPDRWRYLYKLLNPAAGLHSVVISASMSTTIEGSAASYTGVLSISTLASTVSSSSVDELSAGTAIPTDVDNCWLVGFVFGDSAYVGDFTAGDDTVLRGSIAPTNNQQLDSGATVGVAGAHEVTVNFTTTATEGFLMVTYMRPSGIPADRFLYAQDGDWDIQILDTDTGNWDVVRSGLKQVSKARFTQYLNYIWMVNGNVTDGDAVKTSNGGTFGTTLVPSGFPPGDYIQAGFEGRVWVADKLNDVVYFTDIVQFTPPDTYTLTYNAATNFIKNFSPQNGQTITGLFTTPRALLLFKQDSIYRIYGAYAVDSYPAYNVGTFSQESIVQTKDGIYFHHSSGFYKFAYDSQPVEISRRIIDFVKAIPRANYDDVLGIYDNNDAIIWYVGPVTVEGVTFSNCSVRYTISTQVWTIYDYKGNDITALILFDDGENINMIVGANQT